MTSFIFLGWVDGSFYPQTISRILLFILACFGLLYIKKTNGENLFCITIYLNFDVVKSAILF